MLWNERLKEARRRMQLSLRAVEAATGISNPYLSQLENGFVAEPGFFLMVKLARFYGLELEELVRDE